MTAIFLGLGANGERQWLELSRANRHGLIAGATGTGKTVTLQGLAESFSAEGVPVFLADVKGDLAGLAMPGSPTAPNADKLAARAAKISCSLPVGEPAMASPERSPFTSATKTGTPTREKPSARP